MDMYMICCKMHLKTETELVSITVQQEIFVRNLISSLSSKQIKFLTKFFHETTSVGSEILKNAKINDKQ